MASDSAYLAGCMSYTRWAGYVRLPSQWDKQNQTAPSDTYCSVEIIEDEEEGHIMISLFCTWLDNSSFWGRPYFLLRLACSGTLHWGRHYGWKSGWAEVPTTLAVVDPSSNCLAYFRPQYHVWSPLESHLNNVCWTIFGLTVAFLAARLGWHSLGLCIGQVGLTRRAMLASQW